jgi:hypothetical protein
LTISRLFNRKREDSLLDLRINGVVSVKRREKEKMRLGLGDRFDLT